MKRNFATARIGALTVLLAMSAAGASAQDAELSSARDLYASAAYDDALVVLNKLRSADHPASQSRAIEQYRAFCLLALGRAADAEQAIEAVVVAEPTFQPGDSDASPRIRQAFTSVRRRMLPSIIQQKYASAKAAFDRREFAAAADGFTQVLNALGDPDLVSEAKQPPLSDLRTLAGGFHELAAKASAPPPAPPPPAPVVVAAAAPAPPPAPRIYSGGETGLVLPVALNQSLPAFPGQVIIPRNGKLEVVIDETGAVESATITASVTTNYDAMVLIATRAWRFRPAMVNGTPVKFRKTVQITIKLTS
jgi:TonB family protein